MPIPQFAWSRKTVIAVVLGLSALGVWVWRFGVADSFDPRQFQKTEAIEAAVIGMRQTSDGYMVSVRVTNQSPTLAEHIVLTARLIDPQGEALAVNPLVGIQDLAPNDQRTIDIRFPSVPQAVDIDSRIDVTLVRWTDE